MDWYYSQQISINEKKEKGMEYATISITTEKTSTLSIFLVS